MHGVEVLSPVFLGSLALASLFAWGSWVAVRRQGSRPSRASRTRRRGLALGLLTAALLCTTATSADAVNAYFAYLPRLGDVLGVPVGGGAWTTLRDRDLAAPAAAARSHPNGGVLQLPIADAGSGFGPSSALVWLPPQYLTEPARRFPVVYLFHGSPGVPADWLRGGQAAETGLRLARAGQPLILVMPRMSHGWLDDPECVDGAHERIESHFTRDVVPAVDAALRTVPRRDSRAVAGMSAGGFCALNLGLKHRDLVGTVLDMSGLPEPTHRGGLSAIYGQRPDLAARAAADTPLDYLRTLPPGPPMHVWLDTGGADAEVLAGMRRVDTALSAYGIDTVLRVRPGAHTFHVWRPALVDALSWAAPELAPDRRAT